MSTVSTAFLAFALLGAATLTNACPPKYFIVCPEVLQVGVEQTIVVSVFSGPAIRIKVQVETLDGFVYNRTDFVEVPRGIKEFNIRIPCANVPDESRYAFVRVLSDDPNCPINDRRRVVLGLQSMSVFLQTDKPVYRRDDDVRIRFVAVKPDLTPVDDPIEVTVDIKNPQGIIVDRFLKPYVGDTPIISNHSLNLGHEPMFGQWTIQAKYGCKNSVVSDFHFQVEDYVLPRFEVIITPPRIISATNKNISVHVKAIYTYGKPVVGKLNVTLGLAERSSSLVQVFRTALFELTSQNEGIKKMTFPNSGYGVFPEGKLLYIYAGVTEKASQKSQSSKDVSAVFTASPIVLDCSLSKPFYLPKMPYDLKIRARYANGDIAAQKAVRVIMGHDLETRTKRTDTIGVALIKYTKIVREANEIVIRAGVGNQLMEEVCRISQGYQTTCGYYIGIVRSSDSAESLKKGASATFRIKVNKETNTNGEFHYHIAVVSCGKLQKSYNKTIMNGAQEQLFEIEIDFSFCSTMCAVAYYETNCNGSSAIISDYTCMDVEEKCSNDITVKVDVEYPQKIFPGHETELTVTAAEHSYIALLAVDKGLYVINNETKLTKEKIFKELRRYDTSCEEKVEGVEDIFSAVGLTYFSNSITSPSERKSKDCAKSRRRRELSIVGECLCNQGKKIQRLTVASASADTAEKYLVETCRFEHQKLLKGNSALSAKCPNPSGEDVRRFLHCCSPEEELELLRGRSGKEDPYEILNNEEEKIIHERTYFPHVWLFDQKLATGDGRTMSKTIRVPDTITDWSIQGLAFSKKGFCASDPVFIRAFKDLFVECHLPFSLRRREQITVACTVYNYRKPGVISTKACLRLVDPGEDICTTAGAGQSTDPICFFMEAQSTKTVLFPVVPLQTGKSKLKIRLVSEFSGEDVETEILVEPEGVFKEYSYSTELDPQGTNAFKAQNMCKSLAASQDFRKGYCYKGPSYLPPNNSKACSEHNNIIAKNLTKEDCCDRLINKFAVSWSDGTRCELCPKQKFERQCANGSKKQINTFYIRLPESYVAGSDTAWLSVTGKYFQGTLKAVDNVESLLREPGGCGEQSIARFAPNVATVKHLNATGELFFEVRNKYVDLIQRGYQYQLRYRKPSGAFAKYQDRLASTWLSAFVLQTFCDARNYATIDPNVIQDLITFLTTRQAPSGAIFETYTTSSYLIGGVKEGDASLTAYVINGALECCQAPNHPLFTSNSAAAFCRAVTFLERHVENNTTERTYSRAIVYAALVKACTTCRLCECRAEILTKARRVLDQDSKNREDGARFWSESEAPLPNGADAISVEMTAYALCGYVEGGHVKEAGPLAKWLNSERNAAGAFKSTQDTVMALRCLAKFASAITLKRALTINITASKNKTFTRELHVNDVNKGFDQRIELPRNDIIRVESMGNGLGMLQVHVEYNELTTEDDKCMFNFSVTPERLDYKNTLLAVCAQYVGDVDTDQAIVEVELPTGYVACKEGQPHCLKELNETRGESIRLDRIETSGRGVIFYFDQIAKSVENSTCFTFRAKREYQARSLTAVSAKVYYYYRQDQSCTIFYALDDAVSDLAVLCSKPKTGKEPLCVCGAGRCPKLEPISERLCNACLHHDYVYRIQVKKIKKENGWQRTKVNIVDILKPGQREFNRSDEITLWMPITCSQSLPFKRGENYHIQGKDGINFVLDHTSLIEKWPRNLSTCGNIRTRCEQRECSRKRTNKRDKCNANCKNKQKDCKKFFKYVTKMKDGANCEEPREKLCPAPSKE